MHDDSDPRSRPSTQPDAGDLAAPEPVDRASARTDDDVRAQLYAAVKHTLDQIQENPDVHYYCGYGTQIFYLLIRAEAAHLGKPLDDVETARRKDRQPSYRRREAEVLRLRDERDELRTQLDSVGSWPR